MLLKLILKIWPALLPIAIYCLWILVRYLMRRAAAKKSGNIIDGVYTEVKNDAGEASNFKQETGDFSLHNQRFVKVLYLSLFIAIICFLFFAIRVPRIEEGEYVPAHIEDGKVIPAKIIQKNNAPKE